MTPVFDRHSVNKAMCNDGVIVDKDNNSNVGFSIMTLYYIISSEIFNNTCITISNLSISHHHKNKIDHT